MIVISQVTLKNFLSVGASAQSIKLDNHGLTLVLGNNVDGDVLSRNGAGKTTILQGISYGLYGKPLTKIKIPNLVNNINKKNMLVCLDFKVNDISYRIERGQKPAVMRMYVNNRKILDEADKDEAQGENKDTQAEINRLIGMSHSLFRHIVALNTFTEPFLKLSIGEQRLLGEELLGVTQISQRADNLKKLMSQTREEVRDYEARVKATSEANSRIEAAVKTAVRQSDTWDKQHKDKISSFVSEINNLASIDFSQQLALFDAIESYNGLVQQLDMDSSVHKRNKVNIQKHIDVIEKDIVRINKEISSTTSNQSTRLENEITRKRDRITSHETHIVGLKKQNEKDEADIMNADESICVCCHQKLTGTDHLDQVIANLRLSLENRNKKIVNETDEISILLTEISEIENEITRQQEHAEHKHGELLSRLTERQQDLQKEQDTLRVENSALSDIKTKIANLQKPETSIFDSRDDVYNMKTYFENLERDLENEKLLCNPHIGQIETLVETIQNIDMEPLNALHSLYKHQDFLLKLLMSKDSFVRKKIIEQNLAYLNSRLEFYLVKLGLPHNVKFMNDLTVEITLMGRDMDFEQLSRGEMNRVILSTSWSFRDVWEGLNNSINLLWVDEMLDQGTDGQGVEAAIQILQNMSRDRRKDVFLISHREELQTKIDKILRVTKSAEFTTFEEVDSI